MRSSTLLSTPSSAAAGEASLLMVADLGARLADVKTMQELAGTLQRRLKWVLPLSRFALYLIGEDGAPYPAATSGEEMASTALLGCLVDWSVRHDTSLDVPNLADDGHIPATCRRSARAQECGALVVLPLHAAGTVLGALALNARSPYAYAGTDPGLLNLVRSQVASTLERVLLLQQLDGAKGIVASMVRAVEAKDPYTSNHAARVTRYAIALADRVGASQHVRRLLEHGGPLHDVGKIGVPDAVLLKPARLTPEEFEQIQRHPVIGDEICSPLQSLIGLRPAIRHHHERFDGQGYPDGLVGERIPVEARILALADAYDAMTSKRAYRPAMSVEHACAIIERNQGPQWDPRLARHMVDLIGGGTLSPVNRAS